MLHDFLQKNEYQFRKILHNKRKDTFFKGFKLSFSMIDNKDVAGFNDVNKIIVSNKLNGNDDISIIENGIKDITKLFTDGCFLQDENKGGIAAFIIKSNDSKELISEKTLLQSSCLIELYATIKGLEKLENEKKIRVITDSQYVRKGITEWIFHWKLNNWHTANGEKAKNIEYWKRLDKLIQKKYIEFQWVKGHAESEGNKICHEEANRIARE